MEWHGYLGPSFYHDRIRNRMIEEWWEDKQICEALIWFRTRRESVSCERCTDPDGMPCLPHYGLAPHTHDSQQKDPGKFDIDEWIGSTRFYPKDEWPDNFVEDPDSPNHGTWYCSFCWEGWKEKK